MNARRLWIALAIAAAVGSIVSVLYAPGGYVRRRKLAGAMEEAGEYLADAVDYIKDRADSVSENAGSVYHTTAHAVAEVASEAADGIGEAVTEYAQNASKLGNLTKSMV